MGETNSEDKARYDFKKDMQEITNYSRSPTSWRT